MLALAALTLAACGGDSTGPGAEAVEGDLFTLQTVNGSALPARFEPADVPGEIDDALITGATMAFLGAGRVDVSEDYVTPNGLTDEYAYRATFIQSGTRVLIYSYGTDFPPDTGVVSGNTLTVRAQFYRETEADRYVLAMIYRRN